MRVIMFWQTSEDTSRLVKAWTESDGELFFFLFCLCFRQWAQLEAWRKNTEDRRKEVIWGSLGKARKIDAFASQLLGFSILSKCHWTKLLALRSVFGYTNKPQNTTNFQYILVKAALASNCSRNQEFTVHRVHTASRSCLIQSSGSSWGNSLDRLGILNFPWIQDVDFKYNYMTTKVSMVKSERLTVWSPLTSSG